MHCQARGTPVICFQKLHFPIVHSSVCVAIGKSSSTCLGECFLFVIVLSQRLAAYFLTSQRLHSNTTLPVFQWFNGCIPMPHSLFVNISMAAFQCHMGDMATMPCETTPTF